MRSLFRSASSHPLVRSLRLAVPLLLLVALVAHLGTEPFERSLHVLSPGPIVAALLLGGICTVAQALRWRTVAIGYGAADGLTKTRAVQECYRSALLNAVLPGGVMGDALRVWRQRGARERGLRSSAQAVVGERVAGTALLLAAVAVVTLPMDLRVSGIMAAGAGVAGLIAAPTLKRLSPRDRLAVWGWSLLALASLVIKFALAAMVLGTVPGISEAVVLALIALAGMAVPVGIGGFGPREAVAAVAFGALGLSAESGVTTAAAYGVLAAVSALPGVVVMFLDSRVGLTAADRVADRGAELAAAELSAVDLGAVDLAALDAESSVLEAEQVLRRNGFELAAPVRWDDAGHLDAPVRLNEWITSGARTQITLDSQTTLDAEPARQSA
jgi:glycosyltransferase 2 family protein